MGSPNLFQTLDSKGFPQDSATQAGVGRTLLSAAFDFAFDLAFYLALESKHPKQTTSKHQNQDNFKGSGQECPPHTKIKTAGPTSCRSLRST
jgi:hypothetical protein